MSYDFAVWEGECPSSDDAACETFERLMDQAQKERLAPTSAIARYVATLLERWPDDVTGVAECPWSEIPLIENASGTFFYFGVAFSRAEEASEYVISVAHEQGLVCFDPQFGALRLPAVVRLGARSPARA